VRRTLTRLRGLLREPDAPGSRRPAPLARPPCLWTKIQKCKRFKSPTPSAQSRAGHLPRLHRQDGDVPLRAGAPAFLLSSCAPAERSAGAAVRHEAGGRRHTWEGRQHPPWHARIQPRRPSASLTSAARPASLQLRGGGEGGNGRARNGHIRSTPVCGCALPCFHMREADWSLRPSSSQRGPSWRLSRRSLTWWCASQRASRSTTWSA